jgi:hypothetical protein
VPVDHDWTKCHCATGESDNCLADISPKETIKMCVQAQNFRDSFIYPGDVASILIRNSNPKRFKEVKGL